MPLLYDLVICLFFVFALPLLALRRKTRGGFWQRLGFQNGTVAPGGGRPRIWFHGASAGDLLTLSPMVRELKARFPASTIVVSTLTDSGLAMGRQKLREASAIIYAPWDLPGATRRAARAIAPDLLVLEYTEIWPNLIRAAKRQGAAVVLANGRFSAPRLGAYRTLFAVASNPLRRLDALLMRSDAEARRAIELGAPAERVVVTGNTKFDALLPAAASGEEDEALRTALGFEARRRLFIAGSTHEGEEPLLFGAYQALRRDEPDLRLVVAPRYLERAPKIAALAEAVGLTVRLRSSSSSPEAAPRSDEPDVAILDTIGELSRVYRLATLVFVGGSFVPRGGQNILEPAAQGKPVLFGPFMDNFREAVELLDERGAVPVRDAEELTTVARALLRDPQRLAELGARALAAVTASRGAAARNVDRICSLARVAEVAPRGSESIGGAAA